jgi:hypothetical protein
MIKIDRTRIAPTFKFLDMAKKDEIGAKQFYLESDIQYGNFNFAAYRSSEVRESLLELFYEKCAYCESKLDARTELEVDRFRPTAMAVNHDGSIDKPGYWWLAWEWSNLYPTCPLCSRTKADRFPVVGQRV